MYFKAKAKQYKRSYTYHSKVRIKNYEKLQCFQKLLQNRWSHRSTYRMQVCTHHLLGISRMTTSTRATVSRKNEKKRKLWCLKTVSSTFNGRFNFCLSLNPRIMELKYGDTFYINFTAVTSLTRTSTIFSHLKN